MSNKTKQVDHGARRFGVTAVQAGHITQDKLLKALSAQVMDNLEGKPHRLVGEILCAHDAMTFEQVDQVLKVLATIEQVFD